MDIILAILDKEKQCIEAYRTGKVLEAKQTAEIVLEEMFEYKKIVAITNFLKEIKELGYPHKKIIEYETRLKQLCGEQGSKPEQMEWHINHFKISQEFFRNYLIEHDDWEKEQVQLSYEYVLRFGTDEELMARIRALNPKENKVIESENEQEKEESKLHHDYEQIAYDLISGKKALDEREQTKIIFSLLLEDNKKTREEKREMVTAFRFLGMDDVVIFLCEKLIPLYEDTRDCASLIYISIESLINKNENLKALQSLENFLLKAPVYGDEKLALEYLRAEINYNLGRNVEALKQFKAIHKINPHYRRVSQRIKFFEGN